MPVDLNQNLTRKSLAIADSLRRSGGFVVVHPRYRAWLAKCGVHVAEDYLSLRGVVVSGHADRHVMRVELGQGPLPRIAFLKREHHIGWRVRSRNHRAGFGRVSRSEREAKLLRHLEEWGLAGPQWIAYGEDGRGRAFLLVDELTDMRPLHAIARVESDGVLRREIAEQVGIELAALHAALISTPDLSAKHVYARTMNGSVAFVDWASARLGEPVTFGARVRALAQLNASLPENLASLRERVRMLRAYLRGRRGLVPLREWIRQIVRLQKAYRKRSAIRDQHGDPAVAERQQVVWLASNEEVCVTPKLAEDWPVPPICEPYYPEIGAGYSSSRIVGPDGESATLLRWRTRALFGRLIAWLRGTRYRSPGLQYVKDVYRRQRFGEPTPTVLAFGQCTRRFGIVDSFVLLRKGGSRS